MKRILSGINSKNEKMLYFYATIDVPYSFIPETVREWLETGGLEELKEKKPMIANWIKRMRKDIPFPYDLKLGTVFTRKLEELMKTKGCLQEDEILRESEIFNLIRYRYNPLYTKSKRIRCLAESALELIIEKLKENPDRKDIQELAKLIKHWIKLNKEVEKNAKKGNK